ncbi:MAG: VTT domain-containing protein [Candidatus Curtissbacteria bacterium]
MGHLIQIIENLAAQIPLPLFVIIGSLVEEIIAPIPSPFVMTLAGSIVKSQGLPLASIVLWAIIAAGAKTVGSWVLYFLTDKIEDVILSRFGKLLGFTHKDVEGFGKYLNRGWRDNVVLFLLRAIPIVPTAPVSVVCGLIKINLKTYLVSTFLGNIVRSLFYLYFGYTSLETFEKYASTLDNAESVILFVLTLTFIVAFGWWLHHKHRDTIVEKFLKKIHRGK